jgi:hypothetical protein
MDETVTEEPTSDLSVGNLKISGWAMFYIAIALIYVMLALVEIKGISVKDLLPATPEPQVIEGSAE